MSVSLPLHQKQKNILLNMLGGKSPLDTSCESRKLLSHVTSRWGVLTLIALQEGTQRFNELRRKMNGISERMLTKVLKDLEEDGLVTKKSLPVIPPHTEYTLTSSGLEAARLITLLTDWIGNYQLNRNS